MDQLLPISGYELNFKEHKKIFKTNVYGSNCYSYAMNHAEYNGTRKQKSVPGDVSKSLYNLLSKPTDWQSCNNAIQRILTDGKSVSKYLKLKKPLVKKTSAFKKPSAGYRKILLVVESNEEPKGISTDFHFYAQNKLPIDNIYFQKRYTELCCNKKIMNNYYVSYNIHPFTSNLKLKKFKCPSVLLFPLKRAIYNLKLHIDMIPHYSISSMVDPFWLLNMDASNMNLAFLQKRYKTMSKYLSSNEKKILYIAKCQCKSILLGKSSPIDRSVQIGLWSHKLGWATTPLNTDGDGKLIINPEKCNRRHGSYDYDKSCQYFEILRGFGTSSIHGLRS